MEYLVAGLYILNGLVFYQILRLIRIQKERISELEKFNNQVLKAKYIDMSRATDPLLRHIATLEKLLGKKEEIISSDDDIVKTLQEIRDEVSRINDKTLSLDDLYRQIPVEKE